MKAFKTFVEGSGNIEVADMEDSGVWVDLREAYSGCCSQSMILPEAQARELQAWLNRKYPLPITV